MSQQSHSESITWQTPISTWALMVGVSVLLVIIFYDALSVMLDIWSGKEEYGYAYLMPAITAFLIWQKRDVLERLSFPGSWLGVGMLAIGMLLYFIGELSTLYIVEQYALIIVIAALTLAFMGRQGFRHVWAPVFLLVFMIPLPVFLYQGLSSQLQLISSELGVAMIRLFDISVHLEGNVIDLGTYKLQVVEACSGLRYLFPLASLAFIAAYIYKGAVWKKVIIFLSSAPITVVMNSFRIGMIGILVEYWGQSAAEGFLHYFEGWVIFMVCLLILFGEMWLLNRVGAGRRPFREAFTIDFPSSPSADPEARDRKISKPFLVASFIVMLGLPSALLIGERPETIPDRAEFIDFPMEIGDWRGKRGRVEDIYLDVLKLDDYLMADYVDGRKFPVNLYVTYYESQRKGESAHSPRSCIPGGGWQIREITQRRIDGAAVAGNPLSVNRVIIQQGDHRQLVYYWFQQRGRNITNEYLVKWYIFWDALTRNRTDGAMVRLTMYVPASRDLAEADKALADFSRTVGGSLRNYIPE